MAGVPRAASFGTDFMLIRADLVRALDNPIDALVWTRINWRCEMQGQHTVADEEGLIWWPASREVLSEETGLSADQVKRSLIRLKEGGFIDATELRTGGNYDRTKSYRPLFEGDSPSVNVHTSTGRERPIDGADVPNVPSTKTLKTETPQREAQKHATRITEDWLPSEAQREKTLEEYGKTHDIQRELASFRDHWMAAAGQNARKLDWDATWRNWMRRANPRPGFSPTKATAPQGGKVIMSKAERNLAQMDPEYLRRIGVDPTPGGGMAVAQQEIVGGVAGGPIVVEVLGEQGRVQQTFHSHRSQQGMTS